AEFPDKDANLQLLALFHEAAQKCAKDFRLFVAVGPEFDVAVEIPSHDPDRSSGAAQSLLQPSIVVSRIDEDCRPAGVCHSPNIAAGGEDGRRYSGVGTGP